MPPSYNSPKRKRGGPSQSKAPNKSQALEIHIPPTPPSSSPPENNDETMRHTANLNGVPVITSDEQSGSPRTKVAYHFRGLQLEDGGDVGKLSLDLQRENPSKMRSKTYENVGDDDREDTAVRKRMRVLDKYSGGGMGAGGRDVEIPETPMGNGKKFGISIGPERNIDPVIEEKAKRVVLHNEVDPVIFKGSSGSGLARAYPSINRLADSKSRGKSKTAGTSSLFGAADASKDMRGDIVDEERASMTWHDDEITGHDPSDPEDDGEGINGIGFRPTAAEAYARAQKRKQQMLEYKTREAADARARRIGRRGGTEVGSREEKEAERRVRFIENEKASIVSTG